LICWCGDGTPIGKKGLFNMHVNDVANYFRGFHVQINARTEDDVDPKLIMQKVKDSSGAKYSIQSNVNPSIAKPAPKPAYAPPKPTFTPKPVPAAVTATIPVKPAPAKPPVPSYVPAKPVAPPVVQPVQPEPNEPKPLFSSASSTYQPIKTNPKPLNNPFAQMEHQQTAPSIGKVSQLASTFTQQAVKSSYEPIKMNPKPLYDEGAAKVSYQQTSQPSSRKSSVSEGGFLL
jgi:hypothetical protein